MIFVSVGGTGPLSIRVVPFEFKSGPFRQNASYARLFQYSTAKLGRTPMRKLTVTFIATAAILLAGLLAFKADAQTSRGAATIPVQAQNFSPIEKAACGPYWGRWCGPWHRRVCGQYRCWCARC
jgi:hypothetical protein